GRGIGKALLTAAKDEAIERGMRRLELTVMTHNTRALNLYLNCGFEVEGLRRDALIFGGVVPSQNYMGLLLAQTPPPPHHHPHAPGTTPAARTPPRSNRHDTGRANNGPSRPAKKPSPENHTQLATTAPTPNSHRPSTPCWLARTPSSTTVSRYTCGFRYVKP